MILKMLNAFFIGLALVLLPDFLFFIGLKLHYFDYYKITEYFNIYFFDNQIFWLLCLLSLIVGYLLLYGPLRKSVRVMYLLVLVISMFCLTQTVGQSAGEALFMQKDQRFMLGKTAFTGDLLYEGRQMVYIKREGIPNTIKLKKEELTFFGEALE